MKNVIVGLSLVSMAKMLKNTKPSWNDGSEDDSENEHLSNEEAWDIVVKNQRYLWFFLQKLMGFHIVRTNPDFSNNVIGEAKIQMFKFLKAGYLGPGRGTLSTVSRFAVLSALNIITLEIDAPVKIPFTVFDDRGLITGTIKEHGYKKAINILQETRYPYLNHLQVAILVNSLFARGTKVFDHEDPTRLSPEEWKLVNYTGDQLSPQQMAIRNQESPRRIILNVLANKYMNEQPTSVEMKQLFTFGAYHGFLKSMSDVTMGLAEFSHAMGVEVLDDNPIDMETLKSIFNGSTRQYISYMMVEASEIIKELMMYEYNVSIQEPWTPEEDDLFGNIPPIEIERKTGRSRRSVRRRLTELSSDPAWKQQFDRRRAERRVRPEGWKKPKEKRAITQKPIGLTLETEDLALIGTKPMWVLAEELQVSKQDLRDAKKWLIHIGAYMGDNKKVIKPIWDYKSINMLAESEIEDANRTLIINLGVSRRDLQKIRNWFQRVIAIIKNTPPKDTIDIPHHHLILLDTMTPKEFAKFMRISIFDAMEAQKWMMHMDSKFEDLEINEENIKVIKQDFPGPTSKKLGIPVYKIYRLMIKNWRLDPKRLNAKLDFDFSRTPDNFR